MKEYKKIQSAVDQVMAVRCNCCGQVILPVDGHPYPDFLSVEKIWGYDSPFDGEKHKMDICPSCYIKWTETFLIQPDGQEETEYI